MSARPAPVAVRPATHAGASDPERRVREGVLAASRRAEALGMPGTSAEGQLIRPLLAWAGLVGRGGTPSTPFWQGVLAVQLAHEASLVHDDIIDGAPVRRGVPTAVTLAGVGPALVAGDHLLTASYRVAAGTGSLPFASLFARAVERTVAGEIAQGRAAGERLDRARYESIALGKAGELMGCALATGAALDGAADLDAVYELGRRVGLLYQMLDDLLDYCPGADTGKPALGDYLAGRWTWPLEELPGVELGGDAGEVARALHAGGGSARCLGRLERMERELVRSVRETLPEDDVLVELLARWVARAREAVSGEAGPPARTAGAALRERIPGAADAERYLALHSRSFRFAARLFPPEEGEKVARVYAYCRATDDLVDRPGAATPEELEALLEEWVELSRRAYHGETTGLELVDRVMGEMAAGGVPFRYAAELVEGMRMDLRAERYATAEALGRYTYRVASVVGLWLTRLFGVHDPLVLERAARMGHAMQLTNILRDVGEDWGRGRLYLPLDRMRAHGVDEGDLSRMCAGGAITPGYRALVEELLTEAEGHYRAAFAALPALPRSFQRPVAVAAYVYRGIHASIRRNGYDNVRLRAYTYGIAKVALAGRALWDLRVVRQGAEGLPVVAGT